MSVTAVVYSVGRRRRAAQAIFPTTLCVQDAAKELAERFDATGLLPSNDDLSQLLQRFILAHHENMLNSLSRRDWVKATWGIWDRTYPLSDLENFWPEYHAFLKAHPKRSYYKNLILTYLCNFDAEDAGIDNAGRLIREFIASENHNDWLWTKRHRHLHLFDPKVAARYVANFLLSVDDSLDDALINAGCHGVAARGGMERAAFGEALKELQGLLGRSVQDAELLQRTLAWAEQGDELRFATMRVQLAECLLSPWRSAQPSATVQSQILDFLLKHYRDPRLNRQKWIGISEQSQQMVRRWLTKASLEQFIGVVSRVAEASHWKYRKAFWMSYYDNNLIDEAWVLFGRAARHRAQQAFEEATGFGRIDGGLSNHCVLLLKIGDLTIADWSHDGKCRIWNGGNRNAPNLYQLKAYSTVDLQRNANFEQAHHGSERHTWQDSIASYIRDKTSAWVARANRIPRGQ